MANSKFDETRLERGTYDYAEPLSMGRFIHTSGEFMDLVRQNVFQRPEDAALLDRFCEFVDSKHVWNLAQMVIPEFRSAAVLPEEDRSCLDYILRKLSNSPLFPQPRPARNILTREFDLLQERHRKNVEYLLTGGQGRSLGTEEQVSDVDNLAEQVAGLFQASLRPEQSRQSKKGRKKQGGKAAVAKAADDTLDVT